MARTPQDVTDTELTLLQRLWDAGPLTIRQLTDYRTLIDQRAVAS